MLYFSLGIVNIRGLEMFDATFTLQYVVLPILLDLADLLVVPYFLARCAGWCNCLYSGGDFSSSGAAATYGICAVLVRNCHLAFVMKRLLDLAETTLRSYLSRVHKDAKASWRLTGAQLVNRE